MLFGSYNQRVTQVSLGGVKMHPLVAGYFLPVLFSPE